MGKISHSRSMRRTVGLIFGLVFGISGIVCLSWGTAMIEMELLTNATWLNLQGMLLTTVGIAALSITCLAGGWLSSTAFLPPLLVTWLAGVFQGGIEFGWWWPIGTSLSWSSYFSVMAGALFGGAYACWNVRHNSRLVCRQGTAPLPHRRLRTKDWWIANVLAGLSALIIFLIFVYQASYVNYLASVGQALSGGPRPEVAIALGTMATIISVVITMCASISAFGAALSGLVVLCLPAVGIFIYDVFYLQSDFLIAGGSAWLFAAPLAHAVGLVILAQAFACHLARKSVLVLESSEPLSDSGS